MDRYVRFPFRTAFLLGVALLFACSVFWALPAAAHTDAENEGGVTLDYVVDRAIIGHAADGFYLDFEPIGVIELPRLLLVRDAEGGLGLDAALSTKRLLQSDRYDLLMTDGDEERRITSESDLNDAFASKDHFYGAVVPAPNQGTIAADLSITRHFMFSLAAMAVVFVIFAMLAGKYKRGAGREEAPRGIFQNMMEVLVVFIREEIAKPNVGPRYKTFLPFLLSAFFFILAANILGLVPFSGSATGNIAVTGVLALSTFIIGQVHATSHHWKHLFLGPSDAPLPIRMILVPIEIAGLFTRHIALAIRLFANMMGGALIIFSLIGVVFIMNALFEGAAAAWGSGIISTGFTVFILLLKFLIAFIQAYVFTILSALFIGMAVEEHDDHGEAHASSEHEADTVGPDSVAATPAA